MATSAPLLEAMTSIWNEIWSARWVADVGVPLIGTLAAIAIAARGIRRQLEHDRRIWRAQGRAEVARALASVLLDAHSEFESGYRSEFWTIEGWPGYSRLRDAIDKARVTLGHESQLRELMFGVSDLAHAWTACQHRRRELTATAGTDISDMKSAIAIKDILLPQIWALRSSAEALMRWDGISEVPKVVWPVRHIPAIRFGNESVNSKRDVWRKFFADAYSRYLVEA